MKYIKQFAIIIIISLMGEVLSEILPFTIPASVYGLLLMLLALMTKVLRIEQVKESSEFLLDIMPIMFVPATVGLMVSWGVLKEIFIPVIIVSVIGTIIVMVVSGKTVDGIINLVGHDMVMTDEITMSTCGIVAEGTDDESHVEDAEIERRNGFDTKL